MNGWAERLRRHPEAWLTLLALALVLIALARPSWQRSGVLHSYLMVIDITQSMNTRDQHSQGKLVSRLQGAKDAVRRTILDLPCGSRVGMALFSEYRTFALFAPVEVCANFTELSTALNRIDGRLSWAGASEIAKGVSFALRTQRALPERPLLAFFTDGHEAPPLDPRYRTRFDAAAGALHGVLVGVGGDRPVPIPKASPEGRALGFWRADEVMHDDPHNLGRNTSVAGETTVGAGAAPKRSGNEHLSSLRETYLQGLAREAGFTYVRMRDTQQTSAALRALPPAKQAQARTAIDWLPALGALLALLAAIALPWLPRRRPALQRRRPAP